MTHGLLARKLGMSQMFNDQRVLVPVTVLEVWPGKVVRVKTLARDGYEAVQLGFRETAERTLNKPELGHLKKHGSPPFRYLREFETRAPLDVGQDVGVDVFSVGERVDVTGRSKGKGFQGVIKRHHFAGGPQTHGSMFHRAPGSIGASSFPSRVWKNQRMPGRMGGKRVTVRGLEVIEVRPELRLVFVCGAVPGATGGQVVIKKVKGKP